MIYMWGGIRRPTRLESAGHSKRRVLKTQRTEVQHFERPTMKVWALPLGSLLMVLPEVESLRYRVRRDKTCPATACQKWLNLWRCAMRLWSPRRAERCTLSTRAFR